MKYILCAAIALLTSHAASAFTLTSSTNPNMKGWEGAQLTLMLNLSNCPTNMDVEGIIGEAAAVWNNVPTSRLKVSVGGTTTSTTTDPQPTIYCETNFQTVTGADQNYVPGAASPSTAGGQLVSGIMYLNVSAGNANIANFDRTTLAVILAHEIGHLVGLGHTTSTNALMYYDGTLKEELRLAQDDIDGVTYLYPSDELSGDKIAGCGTMKMPPSSGPGAPLAMPLVLLMPVIVAWSLRARTLVPVRVRARRR